MCLLASLALAAAAPFLLAHAAATGGPIQPTTRRPSQEELDRADAEPEHWLAHNKGYLGYRYSRLSKINSGNIRDLRQVCAFRLGERGSFQAGPIVYDGVLYVTSALGTFAVDAATCEERWEYHYLPGHAVLLNNKGAAIAGGRVIRGTPDGHLIALDARTGALLWNRQIMDSTNGEFATAAPLIWNDLVFIGKAGADLGIRGEMMAFRASDGEKLWSFYTIPAPGETGSETWKNPASMQHGGGSTWTSYSLDEAAGLLLVPVGNPAPDFAGELRPGRNLFTDSLVALDARTGRLRWWYQLVGADDRDWDTSVVAAFDAPGGSKLAAVAGKDGILHVLDRATGAPKSAAPLVMRYLNTRGAVPAGRGIRLCPVAAVQWNGPAYSPDTNLIYMTGIDWCAQAIKGPPPVYKKGAPYLGWANFFGTRDPIRQAFGLINAIEPATGKVVWRRKVPSPPLGAVTATAGGLVMAGEVNGDFLALDARTGGVLLERRLVGAIGGGVITYEVKGRQFIAVAAGDNNATYQTSGDNEIIVLSMP